MDLPGQGGAEEDKDQGREVQGGVDETAGGRREAEEEKGQGGIRVVVSGGGGQGQTGNIIHEPSNKTVRIETNVLEFGGKKKLCLDRP